METKKEIDCMTIELAKNELIESVDDGIGIRGVLFLQGCTRGCQGCHNLTSHMKGKGQIVTIAQLLNIISDWFGEYGSKAITISGGEPLEQVEPLKYLLASLKEKGYNICLYTSYSFDEVSNDILCHLDYIKTGRYVSRLNDGTKRYVGSSNQKMFQRSLSGNFELMDININN